MAKLFFHQHGVQRTQAGPAKLLGDVHRIEPQRLGFYVNRFRLVGSQKALLLDLVFQRLQFFRDEAAHGRDHHFLLAIEGKVHFISPGLLNNRWRKEKRTQAPVLQRGGSETE